MYACALTVTPAAGARATVTSFPFPFRFSYPLLPQQPAATLHVGVVIDFSFRGVVFARK